MQLLTEATPTISRETMELARLAIRHLSLGVRPWAGMPNEDEARKMYRQMIDADRELTEALEGS